MFSSLSLVYHHHCYNIPWAEDLKRKKEIVIPDKHDNVQKDFLDVYEGLRWGYKYVISLRVLWTIYNIAEATC